MPQNEKDTVKKTAAKKSAPKTAAKNKAGSAKRPAKKTGSRGSAGAGARRTSQKKRKKSEQAWWSWPVTVIMLFILGFVGLVVAKETSSYAEFKVMREVVDFDGFCPGVTIDGADVSGRGLNEVLISLKAYEDSLRDQLHLNLVCGDRTWKITPDDLDYRTDFEQVVREAYRLGREGIIRDRYASIKRLNRDGAAYAITRSYDVDLLRIITDQIADEMSQEAVNSTVKEFDVNTLTFTFTDEADGFYVDAEKLYQDALAAIQSGVGGQTLVVSREVVKPTATKSELQGSFGMITEAKTSTSGSTNNRIKNIELALSSLNGVCIEPGAIFSFNGVVGQRTTERGYRKAGAFVDGLLTDEVGGGICQVSTTLFNAVAKADLTVIERQPHSRPVGYVDEGKDAAVSWPNQDFKFTNNTEFPVYIVAQMNETNRRCIISIYGHQLPDGMNIKIEADVIEVLQPEEDRYIYTTELMTGQKQLVEAAREGYKAVAYKIYLDANEAEIRREILCYSTYKASGAVYKVGQ